MTAVVAPALERRSQYIAWARVLEREYRSLIDDLRNNRPTLLSGYGATSPAEFALRVQGVAGTSDQSWNQFEKK